MRYSVGLPTDRVDAGAEFCSGPAVAEMARAAEAAGFDACFVTEHPFPPEKWIHHGGHHALDPFVTLACAAAATSTLRLQTNMVVAGYRNPFLLAKAVATLDVLSGGRVVLGIAAGYLQGEFRALGADYEGRNEITDEAIVAMQAAWSGDAVIFEGTGFHAAGNEMLPRPVQQPWPPIWVGGNSRRAIRRAVELADGWVPFPTPPRTSGALRTGTIETVQDLADRIDYARSHADSVGRTRPLDVCFVPFGLNALDGQGLDPGAFRSHVEELAGLGVTWLVVTLPARSRGGFCAELDRFGREVLQS